MNRLMVVSIAVALVISNLGCNRLKDQNLPHKQEKVAKYADLREFVLKRTNKDLTKLDLTRSDLELTTFDTYTKWPEKRYLPRRFDPNKLLEWGKDPGLGLKDLHNSGITGSGVNVAIIDQPILQGHVEYKDRLKHYREFDSDGQGPQFHASGVASLMVGKNCGVAPGADLYFWGGPMWLKDYSYIAQALDEIMQFNKDKALKDRIRVVSISLGDNYSFRNMDKWKESVAKARNSGILVITCSDDSRIMGARCLANADRNNALNYRLSYMAERIQLRPGFLYAPIDNRAYASWNGTDAYTFQAMGGLSWGAPYIAGVLALGFQINPEMKAEEAYKILYDTGWEFNSGRLINPKAFIEKVKKTVV